MPKKKNKKPELSIPTTYRLQPEIRDELEKAALEEELNPSTLVRRILRDWFRKRKSPNLESGQNQ